MEDDSQTGTEHDEDIDDAETQDTDTDQDDGAEAQATEDDDGTEDESDADGETVITLPGDSPPQQDEDEEGRESRTFRQFRTENRDLKRRLREVEERERQRSQAQQPAKVERQPEPTLDSCDYDETLFRQRTREWLKSEEAADKAEADEKAARAEIDKALQASRENYATRKAALAPKVRDYDEAEAVVTRTFSPLQQGILLDAAKDPAAVAYAVGSRPEKAKELAAIANPVKFAIAIADLEKTMTVESRNSSKPAPERAVTGNRGVGVKTDQKLAKLEAEADRTGDRTKVQAYKREQRQKAGGT